MRPGSSAAATRPIGMHRMAENLTRLRRIITFHPYASTGEMRQRPTFDQYRKADIRTTIDNCPFPIHCRARYANS